MIDESIEKIQNAVDCLSIIAANLSKQATYFKADLPSLSQDCKDMSLIIARSQANILLALSDMMSEMSDAMKLKDNQIDKLIALLEISNNIAKRALEQRNTPFSVNM